MSRKFMISGLLAAGFGHHDPLQATLTRATSGEGSDQGNLFQVFKQDHLYTLAGHSSHSSHASHASHASHYSSTGGYSPPSYTPPPVYSPPTYSPSAPVNSPPPAYSPAPPDSAPSSSGESSQSLFGSQSPPPVAKPAPLPGRSALFKKVVSRVQVALVGRGLFNGPIDGVVNPATRTALRQFQQSRGLTVTGTITSETLDALHVPSQ